MDRDLIMIRIAKQYFWRLFLCPDNVLTFLSGILVAVSVNILTSQIPESAFTLGWTYILTALLLLSMAVILLWWSIVIKPFQSEYYESGDIQEQLGSLNCWYNIINKKTPQAKSARKKLVAFLALTFILSVLCVILLFFSEYIDSITDYIINTINNAEGQ